jgi:hypothetical protein
MARDFSLGSHCSHRVRGRSSSKTLRLELLEERRVFSTNEWVPLGDLDVAEQAVQDAPIADPAVLVANGNPNTDAASLLAAGGPGDPSLPGFANVSRSGDNGTVIYLGAGWALTANHVALTSTINFGGTWFTVDMSSVHQLKNADNSPTDLKMFRVQGEPDLPEILSSYLATAPTSGHVFMIGNGMTRGVEKFWNVSRATNPWTWTEISEPANPTSSQFGGVTIASPRTIRWGENTAFENGVYNVGMNVTGFLTQFDKLKFTGQAPLPNEAQASAGDSGGAVFSFVNGKWVLSGLMLAVSGSMSGQPADTALYGNITLMADLYAYRTQILNIVGVAGRYVFYNQSSFDGNNDGINAADDAAIATDKSAYLPGSGVATTANMTSYSRGINGIMIDLASTHGAITASDFIFKVGNDDSPAGWTTAPAPTAVSVRPGAGVGGTDRIEITWASGAIANQWLEVVLKGNDAAGGFDTNTGLAASDVFFWGNKVGDSGSSSPADKFDTSSTDAAQVFATIGSGKPVTDLRDYNRDGGVDSSDAALVFASIGSITRINIATGGPFAPNADPAVAATAGVMSASGSAGASLAVDHIAARWESFDKQVAALTRTLGQWSDAQRSRLKSKTGGLSSFDFDDFLRNWPIYAGGGDSIELAWLADPTHRR